MTLYIKREVARVKVHTSQYVPPSFAGSPQHLHVGGLGGLGEGRNSQITAITIKKKNRGFMELRDLRPKLSTTWTFQKNITKSPFVATRDECSFQKQ
jgi:hypothetical protein